MGGRLGDSLDAQRLILLSREQGCEDACVEALYRSNHTEGKCLSDREVLLDVAAEAGVKGAEEQLFELNYGDVEVRNKILEFQAMGLRSVPVTIIDRKYVLNGAPSVGTLKKLFVQLLEHGSIDVDR